MAKRGWLPDIVLVSPATRTRETWALISAQLDGRPEVAFPEGLYPGSVDALLAAIGNAAPTARSVLLIGHNPAIGTLAALLAGRGSDARSLARVEEKFPTAALARYELDGAWHHLGPGGARLTHFMRPKDID